jgi:hypothetical protein
MKGLIALPLVLGLVAPASARVDPEIHKICASVQDYLGCVKAQTEDSASPGTTNTIINREGLVTNEGNKCPDGWAWKGGGYCAEVQCRRCVSFGCVSGNDKILGGKTWSCDRGMWVYLLRWGDSLVRATYDPSCPSITFKPGFNSTCSQVAFEQAQLQKQSEESNKTESRARGSSGRDDDYLMD